MRQALTEMGRVLLPGGRAVVVTGKQSTFYRFATREALYVVPAAAILAEEAERAGFEVSALHDIQLKKANMNARPRSLDDYYETLIMLRRPG
jgi:ubiquinone/menaquinone biosynthesis C-methylase UbiE